MSGADWAILAVVIVLFVLSIWLALAETAFVRMNRIRAMALAEEGSKRAAHLARMLERPEQTLNVVLLLVLVSQLTSATLLGVLLEGTAGAIGVVIGIVLQIVVFFVIGEVAPKTLRCSTPSGRRSPSPPCCGSSRTSRRCACCRAA